MDAVHAYEDWYVTFIIINSYKQAIFGVQVES
jgi:hypothetical protein